MLPTKQDALASASTTDYLALAAREPALPPTLSDFLALLGPANKIQQAARQAALSACVRHLQTDVPESASIQLWLLVSFAPALQAMAGRYQLTGSSLDESVSSVVMAFLETLHALGETRLADPCLALEVVRDTQRRLAYHQGMWASNHAERVVATPDESIMADRRTDERADSYQALQDLIQDMPISGAERGVLIGLYVYGYTLQEFAKQSGEPYKTVQQRHHRLLRRLREKTWENS
jgi:hypothetical protein